MSERIIKVVVIGPESTGKSILCEKLAAHYNTIWVEEYAREFLLKNGNAYTQEDLLIIAKGQIKNEEKAIQLLSESGSSSPFGGLRGLTNNVYKNPYHHIHRRFLSRQSWPWRIRCNSNVWSTSQRIVTWIQNDY